MACEIRTKVIGDQKWSCTQMPASQALEFEARVFPAVLPAIATIFASLGQGAEVQISAINQAFASITRALPPAESSRVIRELCEQAACDGKRVDFELAFSGGKGVALRYQVAWFVLEANYSDFFESLLPAGVRDRALQVMLRRIVTEAAESTGDSGAPSSPDLRSAA